jgi:hypothetical protein
MLSKAAADIVGLLEEKGEEHNTLQRVLLEFLKDELPHLLEVRVEKEYEAFANDLGPDDTDERQTDYV